MNDGGTRHHSDNVPTEIWESAQYDVVKGRGASVPLGKRCTTTPITPLKSALPRKFGPFVNKPIYLAFYPNVTAYSTVLKAVQTIRVQTGMRRSCTETSVDCCDSYG
jgi:hypothetical protein